ncbi:hypothetical protein AVW11_03825 [Streptomyces amritsarensis]|uniref:Uncharacterized protein n=1 Tax=Streptomyces amritsarensis TaxID=681158 RepID=A0ABX3G9A4_9ACTN|nr:hypothetical protein [Streptomyces amritsarensis]OLZ72531.1 hypothetical protein AVW11_03825 [Streptomyces amritsarensis]
MNRTARIDPLVDAEPARRHIRALMAAGVSADRAAHHAGLKRCDVTDLLYSIKGRPPSRRIRETKAQKILAVEARNVVTGRVNATGTRRRIQALMAMGWPQVHLAAQIPCHDRYVSEIVRCQDGVLSRTAHRVATAYDRLWNQDPVQHGVPADRANYVRRLAARRGWPPPAAWDDDVIDDPQASPAAVTEMNRRELAAYRRQEIAHLTSYGVAEAEIAARLDLGAEYVHDLIRDLRKAA